MPPFSSLIDIIAIHLDTDLWWVSLIKITIWAALLIFLGIKSTDHVDQGEHALRRRMGKVVYYRRGPDKGKAVVVGPGWRLLVPFVHSLWKINTQKQQAELRGQIRLLKSGRYELIQVKIFFKIKDIELALVDNLDVKDLIVTTCEQYLRQLIEDGASNTDIETQLPEVARAELKKSYGTNIKSASVVFAGETENSQLATGLSLARLVEADLDPDGARIGVITNAANGLRSVPNN